MVDSEEIDDLKRRVSQIQWWHTLDLGRGVVTPGNVDCLPKLERIQLPEDLQGKTVLDVGAWDGFYSFECERRGAARVLAIDSAFHSWGLFRTGQAGFLLAHEVYQSKVEDRIMEAEDVTPETIGRFDIVLFLGLLYHLHYPHLVLKNLCDVTKELLIMETAVFDDYKDRPAMFIREKDHKWHPNIKACYQLLKEAGFAQVEMVSPYRKQVAFRAAFHARK